MKASRFTRLGTALLVAASLAFGGGASTALAAPTKQGAIDIFYQGTGSFMARKAQGGGGYVWTDDGCSVPLAVKIVAPVMAYASWQFKDQCKQHDFGYRNFGGSLRLDPTESRRNSVDDHFHGRMQARCGAWEIRFSGQEPLCRANALIFYTAVRNFGKF
ncbi:MAG: phospholipase A2 [Ilumatobacteraceae bacterium]